MACLSSIAIAATIYVDDDGSNPRQDGTVTYPYRTLADALAAAAPGDTLSVAPGRYAEPPLTLDFTVSIEAVEPLLSEVVIDGRSWRVNAAGVSITGLRFTGDAFATAILTRQAITVERCQFEDLYRGIWSSGADGGGLIRNNRFFGVHNPIFALGSGQSSSLQIWNNVMVARPDAVSRPIGIKAIHSRLLVAHNHIDGFTVGIYAKDPLGLPMSLVIENVISSTTEGVRVIQAPPIYYELSGNAISAPVTTRGVPVSHNFLMLDEDCGAPGAPFPHTWQPGGLCIDGGVWPRNPDGSAHDIGPAGGRDYGGPWYESVNCIGDPTLIACPSHPVDAFLEANLSVAAAMVFWDGYDDGWIAWPDWSTALRQTLRDAYDAIAAGAESIEPIIMNAWQLEPDDPVLGMAVHDEDARRLYLSHVAGSLHTEITGLVPWSLVDLASDVTSLSTLFDARATYYETIRACIPYDLSYDDEWWIRTTAMPGEADCANTAFRARAGGVIPMEASRTWDALVTHGFLGATRLETIDAVLQWERTHLLHFAAGSIPSPASVAEWYWTRRSLPPAVVMLEGHAPLGPHPFSGNTTTQRHWSRGCGSVGELAAALLRVANVPVTTPSMQGGHGAIHFPSEDAWLGHGDTIYSIHWMFDEWYQPENLLLDGAEWAEWYPVWDLVSYFEEPVVYSNTHMGVEPLLMFLEFLPEHAPDILVVRHCADQVLGTPPDASQVYELFADNFTVAELKDDWNLWTWLDKHTVGRCP